MDYIIKRSPRSSLNFKKIIKTNNLTDNLARLIINDLKSERGFKIRENQYSGFLNDFILSQGKNCDLNFLLVNSEYINIKKVNFFDENNGNHIRLYKLNYIFESTGEYDNFIDLFFVPKFDLIFINGPKNGADLLIRILIVKLNEIKNNPKNKFDYYEITFNPDFLFWLVYKKSINNNITENLSIDKFSNFSTEDFPNENGFTISEIPRVISTDNSTNLITLPIMYGLFNDRFFSLLSGIFIYKGNKFDLDVKIIPDIKPHLELYVRSTQCLKRKSYCDKIKLTLPFINEIIELYLAWEELNEFERNPNKTFIENLKINLIKEFNFTLDAIYNYEKSLIKEKHDDNPIKIFSINPNLDLMNIDDKSREYIQYLVDKNVLLYL